MNGNEPAFSMLDPNGSYTQYGLTKREYFAGLAMQSIAAITIKHFNDHVTPPIEEVNKVIGQAAIDIADALIEALNKPTP